MYPLLAAIFFTNIFITAILIITSIPSTRHVLSKSSKWRFSNLELSEARLLWVESIDLIKLTGDRWKKNSVYQPGGRKVEIRSIKIFRRVGEQIRFGKNKFYHYKYIRFQWRSYSRANPLYARLENQSNSNNKYII